VGFSSQSWVWKLVIVSPSDCLGETSRTSASSHTCTCSLVVIDSATYLTSALLMTIVGGTWVVTNPETLATNLSLDGIKSLVFDGVRYLRQSYFGLLVLIKPSLALLWGAYDILVVSFADPGSEHNRSLRLGIIYATGALGAVIGPMLTDRYANMQAPTCVQKLCLYGMALLTAGIFAMGLLSDYFVLLCIVGVFRGMGSSMIWINSSLLLQKFTLPHFLGQVTTIELALNVLGEAASAFGSGFLIDSAGWTARQVSFALSGLGVCLIIFWTVYYLQGKGAAVFEKMQLPPKEGNSGMQDLTMSETMYNDDSDWEEIFTDVQDPSENDTTSNSTGGSVVAGALCSSPSSSTSHSDQDAWEVASV
jgi:hypothetical protein